MDKVTVYQFGKYDLAADKMNLSKRKATKEAVERHGFVIVVGTAEEVAAASLGGEVEGMTNLPPRRKTSVDPFGNVAADSPFAPLHSSRTMLYIAVDEGA